MPISSSSSSSRSTASSSRRRMASQEAQSVGQGRAGQGRTSARHRGIVGQARRHGHQDGSLLQGIKQLEAEASLVPKPLADALGLADLPKEVLDLDKGKECMQTINVAMQALLELAKPIQEAKDTAAKAAREVPPPNADQLNQPAKPRTTAFKRKSARRAEEDGG
eukprot:713772-Heterocapsa_arctica.AAC.1